MQSVFFIYISNEYQSIFLRNRDENLFRIYLIGIRASVSMANSCVLIDNPYLNIFGP